MTMVDLSVSQLPARRAHAGGVFARISEFLAIFGAAIRAGRAVEARREPSAEDMAILGIKGPFPHRW
jgi:hypothetical protein